jgi:hypothetical protein
MCGKRRQKRVCVTVSFNHQLAFRYENMKVLKFVVIGVKQTVHFFHRNLFVCFVCLLRYTTVI